MKSRAFFKAAMTVVAGGGVLLANAETDAASTVEIVDSVEISTDTNVVVETGRTLKIEYMYAKNPCIVTKSGGGRLVLAVLGMGTNITVHVEEGILASDRPGRLPQIGEYPVGMHVDVSDSDTLVKEVKNGTNFISKIKDSAGSGHSLVDWSMGLPYLTGETLNGLPVLDFGAFSDTKGHVGNAGMLGGASIKLYEYYYVWKDRDDAIDAPLIDGNEFSGPCVLGNDPSVWSRNTGGAGSGFGMYKYGMIGSIVKNMRLDGKHIEYNYRVPRGFHVFRNQLHVDSTYIPPFSTLGFSTPYKGGIVLAEALIFSNRLEQVEGDRIEAYLKSKWFGAGLNVKLSEGTTLDVSAVKFDIGTLDIAGEVEISGEKNLCFNVLTRTSSNVVATGIYEIDGLSQPLVPDVSFDRGARISVTGESRVEKVSSATGEFEKLGDGELRVADPVVSNITVTAGTLNVSPLYARSAEYHLDSTRLDTIDWTLDDGKKLISAWHDMEDPSRKFVKTNYRKPGYDQTRLVRPPYITENAVGDMPMVDFGTFANYNYPDGWGGCLDATPTIGGCHDFFAVWMDHPEVKNYAYGGDGKPFIGPCVFGMQYHWNRGSGGNGESFAIHNGGCPINMWNPPADGLVIVDNAIVHGQSDRIGDGVHVLAQRTTHNDGKPGAPLEQIGGSYLAMAYNSDGVRTNGTYGGLLIGEVLVFKDTLPDRFRMRISGALCSKWRGDTNEWAYGSLKVASGATLKHPHADLVPDTLELAGKISAVSVRPKSLKIVGNEAEIDGTLKLSDGGCINISGDPENGFESLRATSVHASGKGGITMTMANPSAYVGEEYKIIDSANVVAEPDFQWRAAALHGTGTRVSLKAKSDGIYLSFDGCGMTVTIR